jgi:hypothetical protein
MQSNWCEQLHRNAPDWDSSLLWNQTHGEPGGGASLVGTNPAAQHVLPPWHCSPSLLAAWSWLGSFVFLTCFLFHLCFQKWISVSNIMQSFNSWDFLRVVKSWSPMISHWLFCMQYRSLLSTCDGACLEGSVWIWMKSNLFWIIEGQTPFKHLLPCQNKFDPQCTDVECSSIKPPYHLQTHTKDLLNMEGVVCKTTNFPSKAVLS